MAYHGMRFCEELGTQALLCACRLRSTLRHSWMLLNECWMHSFSSWALGYTWIILVAGCVSSASLEPSYPDSSHSHTWQITQSHWRLIHHILTQTCTIRFKVLAATVKGLLVNSQPNSRTFRVHGQIMSHTHTQTRPAGKADALPVVALTSRGSPSSAQRCWMWTGSKSSWSMLKQLRPNIDAEYSELKTWYSMV